MKRTLVAVFLLHESGGWLLWYDGRRGTTEQIGRVGHVGDTLAP
jgi:hypothetical protein